ncbi:MAG: zinc ribbon domain-containing protein [Pseudomonadota bacterium]
MPVYEYRHQGEPCDFGLDFEIEQPINDLPLNVCPRCKKPVQRLLSRVFVRTPKTDTELRDLGFTKLVRRDDGVYENVTVRDGESRVMNQGKPETYPHLHKTIRD